MNTAKNKSLVDQYSDLLQKQVKDSKILGPEEPTFLLTASLSYPLQILQELLDPLERAFWAVPVKI